MMLSELQVAKKIFEEWNTVKVGIFYFQVSCFPYTVKDCISCQPRPPEDYFSEWFVPIGIIVCFGGAAQGHRLQQTVFIRQTDSLFLSDSLALPGNKPQRVGLGRTQDEAS